MRHTGTNYIGHCVNSDLGHDPNVPAAEVIKIKKYRFSVIKNDLAKY